MAAGRMQKQVTEKRDIIDSLQSKLRWSDQAIETADKVTPLVFVSLTKSNLFIAALFYKSINVM